MFFYHEGLPGSGKSYEAVVKHILPALAAGRPVDAYIEGLNHDKLADLAGIAPERCRELLCVLTREQMVDVWQHTRDNALVVLDEMQNFWPSERKRLSPEMTQFITEHRHRGQDILGMGQDLRDVHSIWRRRCAQKIVFAKLDALGAEKRYSVRLFKAATPEKFELLSKGVGTYDAKYFGSYASHVADDTNTANYRDSRAVIWNTPTFRYGLPAVFALAVLAVWYVKGAFEGGLVKAPANPPSKPVTVTQKPAHAVSVPATRAAATAPAAVPPPPEDHIASVSRRWRPRLGAYLEGSGRRNGLVEWYDGGYHRQESMTITQVESFGYSVDYSDGILRLSKGDAVIVVTSWPIDPFGSVSDRKRDEVRGEGRTGGGRSEQSADERPGEIGNGGTWGGVVGRISEG